jgi:hypothetical protein
MSIPLPPLPCFEQYAGQHKEPRARDLAVARVVLEAAANVCDEQRGNWSIEGVGQVALQNAETAIRALEFKHHE